jgi:hypothetical protein
VNANAEIHGVAERAENYPWCSYQDYLGLRQGTLCEKSMILNQVKNLEEYKNFVCASVPLIKGKKELAKFLID